MATAGTINSPTAFSAYTDYSLASLNLNSVMRRLAQGTKSVVDDGAGVAISERMRSQDDILAAVGGRMLALSSIALARPVGDD